MRPACLSEASRTVWNSAEEAPEAAQSFQQPSPQSAASGHRLSQIPPDVELYTVINPLNPWEYKFTILVDRPNTKKQMSSSVVFRVGLLWTLDRQAHIVPHRHFSEKEVEWHVRKLLLEYVCLPSAPNKDTSSHRRQNVDFTRCGCQNINHEKTTSFEIRHLNLSRTLKQHLVKLA